jgi:xanthosine utilization system XapX-like protein
MSFSLGIVFVFTKVPNPNGTSVSVSALLSIILSDRMAEAASLIMDVMDASLCDKSEK